MSSSKQACKRKQTRKKAEGSGIDYKKAPDFDPCLSKEEARAYLGNPSERTMQRIIHDGQLKSVRRTASGQHYFRLSELNRYLNANTR